MYFAAAGRAARGREHQRLVGGEHVRLAARRRGRCTARASRRCSAARLPVVLDRADARRSRARVRSRCPRCGGRSRAASAPAPRAASQVASSKWFAALNFSQARRRRWTAACAAHETPTASRVEHAARRVPVSATSTCSRTRDAEAVAVEARARPRRPGRTCSAVRSSLQQQAAAGALDVARRAIAAAAWRPAAERIPLSPTCAPTTQKRPRSRAIRAIRSESSSPPHLETRMLNASQRLGLGERARLVDRAQRLVDDHRLRDRRGDAAQAVDVVAGDRLLDGARCGTRRMRSIASSASSAVQAQFASTRRSTSGPSTLRSSSSERSSRVEVVADLDLHLPDAERPDHERERDELARRREREHGVVAHLGAPARRRASAAPSSRSACRRRRGTPARARSGRPVAATPSARSAAAPRAATGTSAGCSIQPPSSAGTSRSTSADDRAARRSRR